MFQRKTRQPQISKGLHDATLVRIEELGEIETKFGVHEKWDVIFDVQENGDAYEVRKRVNASTWETSTFGKMYYEIFGELPPLDFDLDSVADTPCQVIITYREDAAHNIWENVTSVQPAD
jgi:hypothetical protein